MDIIDWRFGCLVELLTAQARTDAERRRLADLIALVSAALPADRVAAAYRMVESAA